MFGSAEVLPTFDALGLKEDLLRGVYAYGFERPSAVQQRASACCLTFDSQQGALAGMNKTSMS